MTKASDDIESVVDQIFKLCKMTKEEVLIQKLQDEKKELQDRIKDIKEKKGVNTEKSIHISNFRPKKREISKKVRIAEEKIEEEKYDEFQKKQTEEKKT